MDTSIKVLVVDDFTTMRKIVRRCLVEIGFTRIEEAKDGVEALAVLTNSNEKFGLIISDWNMPNMLGIDLLKSVRSNAKLEAIPFVMVTAEGNRDNILEAARAGVNQYLVKPFTTEVLAEKLECLTLGGE